MSGSSYSLRCNSSARWMKHSAKILTRHRWIWLFPTERRDASRGVRAKPTSRERLRHCAMRSHSLSANGQERVRSAEFQFGTLANDCGPLILEKRSPAGPVDESPAVLESAHLHEKAFGRL